MSQHPKRRLVAWLVSVGALVLVLSAGAGYVWAFQSRMAPRTWIGGVDVGGLSATAATSKLQARETAFVSAPLTLSAAGRQWAVRPSALGIHFNNQQALAEASGYGKQGAWQDRIEQLVEAPFRRRSYAPGMYSVSSVGKTALDAKLSGSSIQQEPVETSLVFTPGDVQIRPGTPGKLVDYPRLSQLIAAAYSSGGSMVQLPFSTFQPTVTSAQAAPAQSQAAALLSAPWTIQIGDTSIALQPQDLAKVLGTAVSSENGQPALTLVAQSGPLQSLLSTWTAQVNRPATDAVLSNANGQLVVATPAVEGQTLDASAAASEIQAALNAPVPANRTLELPTKTVDAAINGTDLSSLGITQLIGTGTTDYSGSPASRVANIKTGVTAISGQLVQPGATFSTVAALGPIDEAHGYVAGLVILNDQTLPEDGGGLCQVSTTLFRAVLNAGLPVTARTAHSYEVSYYQRGVGPGLDATIYDPSPDFKWVNDTGHAIYVQGTIVGTKLTFDLYGTSDGRTAVISGPTVLSTTQPTGDPVYVNTSSLPKGTTELIDPPIAGAKTTATYTVTRDGQVINKQVFNSTYKAMPAQYLVGTG